MMREYLYISERKLRSFSGIEARRSFLRRVRKVGVSAGPVGADVELSDTSRPSLIALLERAERKIRDENDVRPASDPSLVAGHWFVGESVPMAYGTYDPPAAKSGAAIFAMEVAGRRVLLSGSAVHLLD